MIHCFLSNRFNEIYQFTSQFILIKVNLFYSIINSIWYGVRSLWFVLHPLFCAYKNALVKKAKDLVKLTLFIRPHWYYIFCLKREIGEKTHQTIIQRIRHDYFCSLKWQKTLSTISFRWKTTFKVYYKLQILLLGDFWIFKK